MRLDTLWQELEAKALPHVRAQVEALGFRLTAAGGHYWRAELLLDADWELVATFDDGLYIGEIGGTSASELLERAVELRGRLNEARRVQAAKHAPDRLPLLDAIPAQEAA